MGVIGTSAGVWFTGEATSSGGAGALVTNFFAITNGSGVPGVKAAGGGADGGGVE